MDTYCINCKNILRTIIQLPEKLNRIMLLSNCATVLFQLANFPSIFNNLKTKVDNFDVSKLETVPVDLKKLSDAVDNTKYKRKTDKLKTQNTNK